MSDVTDFTTWSSTAASNAPAGGTAIGAGLDDNLRQIQAEVAKWRDGIGYGILNGTSVAGTNTITANTSPAPTLASGQTYRIVPANSNTAASFFNVNSAGNKSIFSDGAACVGGEIKAAVPIDLYYDGTQFNIMGRRFFKQPTRQVFTSGSGTYTTPTGATRINVRMVGGGGGGGGAGAAGSAGGSSTFSTLTASGGARNGGVAGTGTNGDINITGGAGGGANTTNNTQGQKGGGTAFGDGASGGGSPGGTATSASSNTGAGGGGGGGGASTPGSAGGSAGGYVEKLLTAPSASYSYAVGAKGSGDAAGGTGGAGGDGGSGLIIVDEWYD